MKRSHGKKPFPRNHQSKASEIIIVGQRSYQKRDVFENTGHFREGFYKKEVVEIFTDYNMGRERIRIYQEFKKRYPTLQAWFEDDMALRIGLIPKKAANSAQIRLALRSRFYLWHLSLFGLKLDYPFLFSTQNNMGFFTLSEHYGLDYGLPELYQTSLKLNYRLRIHGGGLRWIFSRLILHTGKRHYREFTLDDLTTLEKSAIAYNETDYPARFWERSKKGNISHVACSIYQLQVILYIENIISTSPKKHYQRDDIVDRHLKHLKSAHIAEVLIQYVKQISLTKEKMTVSRSFRTLHQFIKWLEIYYPKIDNLNQLTREIMNKYQDYIFQYVSTRTGRKYSQSQLCTMISCLKVFFDESLYFGYKDVPQQKLLYQYDLPRRPRPLPRFIPEDDLIKLMAAVHALKCPYQRNALILLRWTGARSEEIRRLDINALDYYNDGTPKLFIPIGKTNSSRWIPIHEDAVTAFKALLEIRKTSGNLKGLPDRKTGKITDYLFMKQNYLLSSTTLFQKSMSFACKKAGLLTDQGLHKYTSHQFRHTIGTQMANQGAALATIMKMLGHQSPDMTIRYAHIHDETVKRDYQGAINKEMIIAGGEYAEQIKKESLRKDEIDWIKANFHKTYLLMGHCFHHTRETMCDFADACYFCPKFVTTKSHLPQLKEKHAVELKLIEDAKSRSWEKEVERHTNVAQRVKQIIRDLDEGMKSEK